MKDEAHASAHYAAARPFDVWLARGALLAVIVLQLLIVNDLSDMPRWLAPSIELVLLVALSAATATSISRARAPKAERHWYDLTRQRRLIRKTALLLTAIASFMNLIALGGLVRAMFGGHAGNGQSLLLDAVNIWVTNVIIFALWFWYLDRGGPSRRGLFALSKGDFVFTQQSVPGCDRDGTWSPVFVDYLFVAFTNATAFSPADTFPLTTRAKLLMMVESSISLVTIAVVASRAVGILA